MVVVSFKLVVIKVINYESILYDRCFLMAVIRKLGCYSLMTDLGLLILQKFGSSDSFGTIFVRKKCGYLMNIPSAILLNKPK